ncbi:MAG: spermidine synthase, partial [Myxococcaceae bacterium]|nr:spermidine synthase [Myxococcaceae bacterium]
LAAGLLVALTLPLWNAAPGLFVLAGPTVTSWAGRELVRALVCVELVLLPAAALGLGYALPLRWAAATGAPARRAGQLGAVNTLGAVTGALGAGFGLLPGVGSRHALELLALGCAAAGAWALDGRRRLWALAVPAVLLVVPPWNLARLASGANVYFRDAYEGAALVWAAESPASGLTSVVELPDGVKVLLTNGKFQGATAGELDAQRGIAQAPLLVAKGFERALHIGVGTGCTASFVAEQPFGTVDAVELSSDILEAARRYFGPVNRGVFESPRLRWHLADGRNALLLSPHRYDVIGLELSSIWFAGAADLYHRDFYALAKAHLAPGGVVQQWVQLHHLRRESLAVILASVRAELPHVLLLEHGGQGIILASEAPLTVNVAHLDALGEKLSGTRTLEGLEGGELLSMLSWVVLDEAGVAALAAEAPRVSTDDNLDLEYATPKGNAEAQASAAALVAQLRQARPAVPVEDVQTPGAQARARRWLERAPEP